MNKNSTSLDLLRYAYNETDMKDSDRIQRSMDGDPLIQDQYNEIQNLHSTLEQGKVQPSEAVIQKILEFSKSGNK